MRTVTIALPYEVLVDVVASYLENNIQTQDFTLGENEFISDIDFGLELDEEGRLDVDIDIDEDNNDYTNIIPYEAVVRR